MLSSKICTAKESRKIDFFPKKNNKDYCGEKTTLISIDLSLPHGFNIDDLFSDFNNTFPVFRYRNFKI